MSHKKTVKLNVTNVIFINDDGNENSSNEYWINFIEEMLLCQSRVKNGEEQSARWIEHFSEVLNQPTSAALFDFEHEPIAVELDITEVEITP